MPGLAVVHADPTLALGDAVLFAPSYVPSVTVFGMLASMIATIAAGVGPNLGWLIAIGVFLVAVRFPMLRRGPNSSSRDAWRGFKYAPRRTVLTRAGDRCEGAALVA